MNEYILSFLLVSFTMSMVIVLVSVFNALSVNKVQAKLRYVVWLVVLVGLLIPFRPAVGGGFITIPILTTASETAYVPTTPHLPQTPTTAAANATAAATTSYIPSAEVIPHRASLSLATIVVLAWAAISLTILVYHIRKYFKFMGIVKRWGKNVEDAEMLELYHSIKREKGLEKTDIGLMQCKFVSTSLLTGFLKPVIILPDKKFANDELEMIYRHELIHYKRGDLFFKLLSAIAIAMHWFNPIVYWMCNAIQTECEASCDEAVIQDIGEDNKRFYAELIVEMVGRKKSTTILSTCFYGGKRSLKRRLDAIMDGTQKAKKPAYATLACIVMLTAMSGSVFAFSFLESPDAKTTEDTGYVQEIALATVGGGTVVSVISAGETYSIEVLYGYRIFMMDIDSYGTISNYRFEVLQPVESLPVIETETPVATPVPTIDVTNRSVRPSNPPISPERAVEIAMAYVGRDDGVLDEVELDFERGRWVWDVEIDFSNGQDVEVYIDIVTGEILWTEWD